jgi:RNA polymerase sigma-70 factor, ECF subfamily
VSDVSVKRSKEREHSSDAVISAAREVPRTEPHLRAELPSLEELYRDHADFVWASLHRLGVREADLPDQLQEVFVVVHRRKESFDGTSKVTTWLFGICLRVAAAHRRRAHVRRETPAGDAFLEQRSEIGSPEDHASARAAQLELEALLDAMDLERRTVLVMFEIEEMPCREIASLLGIPVGTVHSRLHAARREFAALLARRERRAR